VLYQLEQTRQITKAQKRDEYLRFCNMLNRLLHINNLLDSIKIIAFDNEVVSDKVAGMYVLAIFAHLIM
jgi:hypothetical protein